MTNGVGKARARAAVLLLAMAAAAVPAVSAGASEAIVRAPAIPVASDVVRLADLPLSTPDDDVPVPVAPALPEAGAEARGPLGALAEAAEAASGALATTPGAPEPDPVLGASFAALADDGTIIPPDTHGAAGPAHLMVTLNSQVRIQTRSGANISTRSLNSFWSGLYNGRAFDPKTVYDPYGKRFITTAMSGSRSSNSAMLLAVSTTSDPTGSWIRFKYDADPANETWVDFPSLGFNGTWIAVQANMHVMRGDAFDHSRVWLVPRAAAYGGSGGGTVVVLDGLGGTQAPAVTFDETLAPLYLFQTWSSSAGEVRLYEVSGAVGAETITPAAPIAAPVTWSLGPPAGADFAPQANSVNKIQTNDARMHSPLYRNGSLWAAHTIFLPAGAPSRSSIQWWEIDPATGTTAQRGLIDDASGAEFRAFPSIAVNADDDVLVGFSSFSASRYAGARYAFRAATDPAGTLRSEAELKAGEDTYYKTYTSTRNRWGDYSATMVDPVNDLDFWTIQEYAETGTTFEDLWGTWWGRVSPHPSSVAVASPESVSVHHTLVGDTKKTYRVTIANRGTLPMTVSATGFAGAHPSDFQILADSCDNSVIAVDSTCVIDVEYAPTDAGTREASLFVESDDPASPLLVPFSGPASHPTPSVSLSPSSHAFGSVVVGYSSSPVTLTVLNDGTGDLHVTSVDLGGTNPADFAVSADGCTGATVAAGATCTFDATFSPSATGERSGTVSVTSDAAGSPHAAALSGTGEDPAPAGSVSPSSASFGTVLTGQQSAPWSFAVSNTGTASLDVGTVTIGGTNPGDFVIVSDACSASAVAPGSSCTVEVAFGPQAAGARSAELQVPSNAAGSPHTAALSGTGEDPAPAGSVSPSSASFGTVLTGQQSAPWSFAVSNTGTASLDVGTATIGGTNPGDFVIVTDACSSSSVAPGSSCTVEVAFGPQAEGARSAELQVPSNAAGSPHTAALSGTGEDPAPVASVSPSSLTFGEVRVGQTSTAGTVVVTNIGTADMIVSSAAVDGSHAADFAVAGETCTGAAVPAGSSCQISVTMTPSAPGTRSASLQISTNAAGSPHTVSLGGTGVEPAASLTPSSMTFGAVALGATAPQQTATLANTGNGAMAVTSVGLTGSGASQFSIVSNGCGATVAAGASCTLSVTFAPTAAGPHGASLEVVTDAPGSPHLVTLDGFGGDDAPPETRFLTPTGAVRVSPLQVVSGRTVDALSAVSGVTVRWSPVLFGDDLTVQGTLSCNTTGRDCSWYATMPLVPGYYAVNAYGEDAAGNIESPGPTIFVIVV